MGLLAPIVLLAGVLIVAARIDDRSADNSPPSLDPRTAPAAGSAECATLLPTLPDELSGYRAVLPAEPVPPATRVWQPADGTGLIVLRCGLDRPGEFTVGAALQEIDGVLWFAAPNQDASDRTWYAVDRPVYLSVSQPDAAGPTPLQAVSAAVSAALPARPIDPAPLPG